MKGTVMTSIRLARFTALLASAFAYASLASAQPAQAPQAPQAQRPEQRRLAATPQGFSVVLVLGDSQSSSTADNVPPAARKALSDMKDFLPYRGYRLLDAQWILGSQHSTSRLRGADNEEYQLTLQGMPVSGRVHVVFQLREPAEAPAAASTEAAAARAAEVKALRGRLDDVLTAIRERQRSREESGSVAALNAEATKLRRELALYDGSMTSSRGRSVIDTSFSMDVGETVVVGTSHVRGGDKALIALLTAVARKGQ